MKPTNFPTIHVAPNLSEADFERLIDGLPKTHPELTPLQLKQLAWQLRGQRAEQLQTPDKNIFKSQMFGPGMV